jgi:hypothetical protein
MAARIAVQAVVLVVLCATAVLSVPPDTYPLDWVSVPAKASGKDLTANCICNLVQFSCDPDCCCDPDCEKAVVNATETAGACLPAGPPDETLDYCVRSSSVKRVRHAPMRMHTDMLAKHMHTDMLAKHMRVSSHHNPLHACQTCMH